MRSVIDLFARTRLEPSQTRVVTSVATSERVGRALLVLSIACAFGYFTLIAARPDWVTTDYEYLWRAARLWSSGVDPYAVKPRAAWLHVWPLFDPLFYPLPAVLLVGLFAGWPLAVSQVVFVTLATAFLAWRLSQRALWPLLIFLTPSFWMAAFLGQWSPWLTLAALTPGAGFLLAASPRSDWRASAIDRRGEASSAARFSWRSRWRSCRRGRGNGWRI